MIPSTLDCNKDEVRRMDRGRVREKMRGWEVRRKRRETQQERKAEIDRD